MATLHLTPGSVINREFKETLAQDQASSEVLVPYGARPTVRLIDVQAPGRAVQYTISPEADIWAAIAVWADWPQGTITGDAIDRLTGAVTGLRLAPTGGAAIWEVVA